MNKSTGPFDALLCVGQFFPDPSDGRADELSDYVEGRLSVPIPTYFTGDYGVGAAKVLSAAARNASNRGFKTDGIEVCTNLYWLKGSGKFSLHGLSVVYLSGRRSPDAEGNGAYIDDDIDALRALAEEPGIIDLFLTNEWPSGVSNGADTSHISLGISDHSGSDAVVSELAAEIKPRYHIAGTKGIFYAREPYSNSEAVHVTRFLGLAAVGNKDKQKFIHAISPTPASTMSALEVQTRPPNTTLSPYIVPERTSHGGDTNKRPANNDADTQYWRYDVSQKRQRPGGPQRLCFKFTSTESCSQGEKCNYRHDTEAREQYMRNVCFDFLNKGQCERGPDCRFNHSFIEKGDNFSQGKHGSQKTKSHGKNCWFCLSSPDVESHLIITVGESYYCALAKGPLVQDHALLIPIEHHPNTLIMASEAEVELGKFKNALNLYFKKQGKVVVFFERIFQHSLHANLQAVPIPVSKASSARRIFSLAAQKLGFEFVVVSTSSDSSEGRNLLRSQFDGKSNLFYAELPDGTLLSYTVDDKEKFPVQFGREVLAGLLNVAERDDWRNSKLSKEDEVLMVESFKQGFEEFDPFR